MNKFYRKFGALVALCFLGTAVFGQTAGFYAETFNVQPQAGAYNIQVGVFYDTTGLGPRDWFGISVDVDYTAPAGVLTGTPAAHGVDWAMAANPITGLTNPATSLIAAPNVTNNPEENGVPVSTFLTTTATAGILPLPDETITGTALAGNVLWANSALSALYSSVDGTTYLMMVIEFPVAAGAGVFQIPLTFDPTPGANALLDGAGGGVSPALNDGLVTVFGAPNCTSATATDNYPGGATGTNINIQYLDAMAGGVGGDIDLTINHDAGTDRISWTGSDGSAGMMATAGAGSTSTVISLTTSGDATPDPAMGSITYTLTPETEFPIGSGIFTGGTACMVTVNWAAPTCSIVFDTIPIIGGATNLDVTLANVFHDGGTPRWFELTTTSANGMFPIDVNSAPAVAGVTLTFDNAATIASVAATDVGSYDVANASGPGGAVAGCSTFLGLQCPTFNGTQCDAGNFNGGVPVQNGGTLTVTLDANDVATWDVTYNGVTDAGLAPGASPYMHSQVIDSDATDVTIDINGFDSTGSPCSDTVVCTLDFEAPTCTNFTQTPDTTVTPANPGDIIALSIDTTNAVSATYDDGTGPVAMTFMVAPDVNYNNTWTANYTAVFPTTITVTVTNADGETTTCTTMIDVNCNASFVGSPASTGMVTIQGIASAGGLDYDIYYSNDCSLMPTDDLAGLATYAGTITLTGAGIQQGTLPGGVVPDVCYYVTCGGSTIILDVAAQRTVPTLGEWGLMAFALLLMGAGVFYMRRRREA